MRGPRCKGRAKSHNENQQEEEGMISRDFNFCFLVDAVRGKKSRLEGLNVGKKKKKKQRRDKRPIVRDRSVPGKEGSKKKDTTGWSPGPIVSKGECSHAWQMSRAIVARAVSSAPPAPALEFHETASACERWSTRLVSYRTAMLVRGWWAARVL